MSKIKFLLAVLAAALLFVSCGGSSTTPVTPSSPPISVEYLDGAGDVALDSTFKATFSQAVDTTTVTTETFFIVPTSASANLASPLKATYNAATCSLANALAAAVSCESDALSCTLAPTANLSGGTEYTICLVPGSGSGATMAGIWYTDSTAFAGTQATFTTAATSISLIDAWGQSISAGTITNINPNTVRLIFSEDMDIFTVTDPNVNLTCGGVVQLITVTQSTTAEATPIGSLKSFDITPADANSLQLSNCTLNVSANVLTLAGTPVTATDFTYTVGCALNGAFSSAATQACWTVSTGAAVTWTTWDLLAANIITYNNGELLYSTAGQAAATVARIYKTVTVPATGFRITINVDNPLGFASAADDMLALDLRNNGAADIWMYVAVVGVGAANPYAELYFGNTYTGDTSMYWSNAPLDSPASYSIQLTVDTTSGIQGSYSRNGADLPLNLAAGAAFPDGSTVNEKLLNYAGSSWQLGLSFLGLPGISATVTSISTPGLTSTTQY